MNELEKFKMLKYGRQIGKTTMINNYLKYQHGRQTGKTTMVNNHLKKQHIKIIFTKEFKKRKTIILRFYDSQIQLSIYDKNGILSHRKHSLKFILKYLKKNLTPDELLEAEKQIFKCF